MDRRIDKTKKSLKSALTSLMKEKKYNDISITELCEKANVNRGTFYLHYSSIEAFLNEIEDDFMEKISKIIKKYYPMDELTFYLLANDLVDEIKKEKEFMMVNVSKNGNHNFVRRITRYTKELSLKLNNFTIDEDDDEYMPFYITFVIEGSIGILVEWIEKGCTDDIFKILKKLGSLLQKIVI